jgi:fatty acid desaturase
MCPHFAPFIKSDPELSPNIRKFLVHHTRKEPNMLWTIFVILLVLWALGLISGYTIGGFIHILLVIAVVVVLIRVIQGRRPLGGK